MAKRCLLWLVIAAVLSWTTTRAAKPAGNRDSQTLPLELILTADRSAHRMSGTLKLETQLRNVSNEDIYIWEWDLCWNPARGLTMWIEGADGKTVQGRSLPDCVPPPPDPGDPYQFVKLGPGKLYGVFEEIKLTDYLNAPGEYDIHATFRSFLSSQWITEDFGNDPISKLRLWTMERPVVSAKRIHITVKP
jgi:hypothetical protein